MVDWEASFKAVGLGALAGAAMGLLGFFFVSSQQHPGMGLTMFLLVPVAAGFAIVMVARKPNSVVAAALLCVLVSLVFLISMRLEGLLCAILAFPIIAAGLGIGAAIGLLARRVFADRTTTTGILILMPLMIVAGARVERPLLMHPRTEVIQTTVTVDESPERVWTRILAIDNVQASKPFLMHIGLPVPQRCTMQGRGVGARRTCYFNNGYIEETVTGWNPPYALGLSIDRTHMPGRHWLGFESAQYHLQKDGAATLLTRATTVSSRLLPVWYWRPFERFGVESEHRYILEDVVRKAQRDAAR
jgi:hypothetical protein